jgi:integrase
MRHTAATLMLSGGVNVEVVLKILGHKDASITLRVYTHVLTSMQDQAVEAMSDLIPSR